MAEAVNSPQIVGPRRILVVDDNVDAAESLAMLLELAGNETRTATDGLAAVQLGATFQPEIVLLDLGMPHMDGYATALRIRAQPWGRHCALIALTGWGRPEDRAHSREAGIDFHLLKPVHFEALTRILRSITSGADAPNAGPDR